MNPLALYRTVDSDIDLFLDELELYHQNIARFKMYILLYDINLNTSKNEYIIDIYLNVLLGFRLL